MADCDLKVADWLKQSAKGVFFMARPHDCSSLLGDKKKAEGLRGGNFGSGGVVRGVLAVTGEAIPLGVCPQAHGKCLSVLHSLSHVVSTDVS